MPERKMEQRVLEFDALQGMEHWWLRWQGEPALGTVFEEDDAARIVACVNAFAGIENPGSFIAAALMLLDQIKGHGIGGIDVHSYLGQMERAKGSP